MSKFHSDDQGISGHFLPEDSQWRLTKLRDYINFLSRLAQAHTSHTSDEAQECAPEVRMEELAICLELLAEQVAMVLEEVSQPAQRERKAAEAEAPEGDDAPAHSPEVSGAAVERFAFGVTLDQIDALDRLIQTLSAYGDVVSGSHGCELAAHTLPLIGHAIHDGAEAVRAILDEVEAQPHRQARGSRTGVGETRAGYAAGPARPAAYSPPCRVLPSPEYRARPGLGLSRTLQ